MIPKSGYGFSEKIALKQQAKAKYRINLKSFRFRRHAKLDHRPAVRQLLEPQHYVDECVLLLRRDRRAREFAEFVNDLRFIGKTLFAATRRLAHFAFDRAIAEIDFDAHLVPVCGAQRRDGGIVHDVHLARQFNAGTIVDAVWRKFTDKDVARENKRGNAERQVELRRGQTFRPVWPAGMIDRDLRRLHDDPFDISGDEWMSLANVPKRVKRRVIAADAGVKLQRNPHRLVVPVQSIG